MTTVLKLGGSVVTEKDVPETVDDDRLETMAAAIADASGPLVVVHGGGSFGHHYASKHGVTESDGTTDARAVREIHNAMVRLNGAVVSALADRGVPALPVHPLSVGARDESGTTTVPAAAVDCQLSEGFVPVLHGDLVAHVGEGVTVVSGDELVASLARARGADRVGLCSTVPGVLDDDGEVIDRIEAFEDVEALLGSSESTDVTGGMAGKVRALLDLGVPAHVFGPDAIDAFLGGEAVGTTIDGR